MSNPWEIYDLLIDKSLSESATLDIKQIIIGLTWTLCQTHSSEGGSIGLAMSPNQYTRTLPWSGTLVQRPIRELASWIKSWQPFEATIGLAVINAVINANTTPLTNKAIAIAPSNSPNLAVFKYFLPKLKNKKVVVIGRYPGLEQYESLLNLQILERNPIDSDLPDSACEYVLPEADWVFITASSITNKTFPRLVELSRNAVTVLMGPSVPWLADWANFGIDFLAGVKVSDPEKLLATVAQGGGVSIFEQSVQYQVLDISEKSLQCLKTDIADLIAKREQLKVEMTTWYGRDVNNPPKSMRFPKWSLLEHIDSQLALLDLRYKRQWDARHTT